MILQKKDELVIALARLKAAAPEQFKTLQEAYVRYGQQNWEFLLGAEKRVKFLQGRSHFIDELYDLINECTERNAKLEEAAKPKEKTSGNP